MNRGTGWIVTNGVLRLSWQGPFDGICALLPLGTNIATELRDFYMSEDVLDWVSSGTHWSAGGFVARLRLSDGAGYGAGLMLNATGTSGSLTPWMSYGAYSTNGIPFTMEEIPPPYRLEYFAKGTEFSLRVVNLTTKQLIRQMSMTDSSRSQGLMGIVTGAGPGTNLESHSITVDNFFLSGTKAMIGLAANRRSTLA